MSLQLIYSTRVVLKNSTLTSLAQATKQISDQIRKYLEDCVCTRPTPEQVCLLQKSCQAIIVFPDPSQYFNTWLQVAHPWSTL